MEAGVSIKIQDWATLRVHKSANRAFLQFSVQLQLSSAVFCSTLLSSLGLSTSYSRFSKEFPRYSSKRCSTVVQKTIKSCFLSRKLLESCSTNHNLLFGLMLKDANCTTKVRFLSIFVQLWGVTCVAKQLWPQLKPKKNCWTNFFTRDIQVPSSVNLRPPFWIFAKNRWPSSPATFILRPWSAPGGRFWLLFFYRKFINCLIKHCEIWKKGQFKH